MTDWAIVYGITFLTIVSGPEHRRWHALRLTHITVSCLEILSFYMFTSRSSHVATVKLKLEDEELTAK